MIERWQESFWLRRSVFLGANAGAGALIVGLLIMPICGFFADRNARIAEQRAALARLQGIIAREALIDDIARETEAQAQAGEFLRGPNEGVISADLQTRLKGIAQAAGAQLRSIQALPPNTKEQTRYIGSRMTLSGTIQTIHRAIHAVESGKPYLFVTAASIKSSAVANPQGPPTEPVIDAELDIYGAVQPDGRER
jgi:hypothetical protein